MSSFIIKGFSHLIVLFALIFFNILPTKYILALYSIIMLTKMFLNIRHNLAILPLYILTFIQGRNLKVSTDIKEIKQFLKGSDKGFLIEELFACPAWSPILSIESVNGKMWETLKNNILNFKEHIPSIYKLGLIAKKEADELLIKKEIIDSKLISKKTLKIFLKWLFCENHLTTNTNKENNNDKQKTYENTFVNNDFDFINQFISEDFLERMYLNGLQWRMELALKKKGNPIKKVDLINTIIEILKKSKFKNLLDWEKPENYSIIMQPFIVSPMINFADISVAMKNNLDQYDKSEEFLGFLDHCLFVEHPFPIIERYNKDTNTQYIIDQRIMKETFPIEDKKEVMKTLNFGTGIRSCLGKYFAKELFKNFFIDLIEKDFFQPHVGHLYSGRSNDKESFSESCYQISLLSGIFYNEIKRNFFARK